LEACIRTQLRSAEDCGAELKFGKKVVTFNASAFGVTVTTDSGERYDAEKLLLAVGADADKQQLAYVYYESEPGRRSAAKLLTP